MNILSFRLFYFLFFFSLPSSLLFGVDEFNLQGDFTVTAKERLVSFSESEVEHIFIFSIKNNLNEKQTININFEKQDGWEISLDRKRVELKPNEISKFKLYTNTIAFKSYNYKILGPDETVLAKKSEHIGLFQFLVKVLGEKETVDLTFEVLIKPKSLDFLGELASFSVSPDYPLVYTLKAKNFKNEIQATVIVTLNEKILDTRNLKFTKNNPLKISSISIPTSYTPGQYEVRIFVNAKELNKESKWIYSEKIEIIEYENIKETKISSFSIFGEKNKVTIKNIGNIESTYKNSIPVFWFERFFFSSNQNYKIENSLAVFKIDLKSGEEISFTYAFNFISLYILILFVLILYLSHIYKIHSNPLKIETEIYQVEKVENEGIKSLKVKIGFENIKIPEIQLLKIIFKMPTYLSVEEKSFLIAEPNKVLKGKSEYKLTWEFKRFELNDAQIIGFTLVNKKGILGDIKFSDLEFEVHTKGKVQKYYERISSVKGY